MLLISRGLKNFLVAAILLPVRRRGVPPGRGHQFLDLYAGLRIPIDLLREYSMRQRRCFEKGVNAITYRRRDRSSS